MFNYSLALAAIALTIGTASGNPITSTTCPTFTYQIDYGKQQFKNVENGHLMIFLSPPNEYTGGDAAGARIRSTYALTSGKFCASLKPGKPVSGTNFAFYLSTGEPTNRWQEKWDELDFEFLGKNPTSTWTNVFHDGHAGYDGTDQGRYIPLEFRAADEFHDYCILYDVHAGYARWTVDNKVVREETLKEWSRPLFAFTSYWGTDKLREWMGPLLLNETIVGHLQNVKFTPLNCT